MRFTYARYACSIALAHTLAGSASTNPILFALAVATAHTQAGTPIAAGESPQQIREWLIITAWADQNVVEISASNFATNEEVEACLASEEYKRNPAGKVIDPTGWAGEPRLSGLNTP